MFDKKNKVNKAITPIAPYTPPPFEEPKCKHHWLDFPWYMKPQWFKDQHRASIDIYEPYVCIHCKKRKDKLLESVEIEEVNTVEEYNKTLQNMYNFYKELVPRAVVEDKILDMQLVDRQYIKIAEQLGYIQRCK